jgi:diguanylate cyclase (GGDEF)-like protein
VHVAGDKALRAVAGVLLHSIRQVDLAARYGEELTVILLDTPGEAALEVAERIRQGVLPSTWVEPTVASPSASARQRSRMMRHSWKSSWTRPTG